ncbi:S8 family serine peptidase, partial [Sandarakinorhabdus oryzae]|uniref:S8 family serine peptidase n=1 Tax=Sandarakinorhabdus oryzae TaxID=2675220 RepID=UPI0012E316A8
MTGPIAPALGGALPGNGSLAGAVPATLPMLGGPLGIADLGSGIGGGTIIGDARTLLDLRRERLRQMVRDNRELLESDPQGNPVRRGELLVLGLPDAALAQLTAQGFSVVKRETAGGAGDVIILRPPAKLKLDKALAAVRAAAPGVEADYNHVYEPAGAGLQAMPAAAIPAASATGASIGMIDGGVAAHPALATARIEQRGFAGAVKATGHGTAVASLLVGQAANFTGAARGAVLLVADVYGGVSGNGSAIAIANAIDWLAARGARVINISLVGPPNLLIARAVAAVQAKGALVVAAVGNDGPAAPPMYPASYAGVVAVTAVDGKDRLLPEAGRAAHVDFAAPGADMAAALMDGGYAAVRGTSFAAPLVTARLAAYPASPLAAVAAEARAT